ncbi:hypothetical protein FZC76_18035 [Sutcliffiella horikoshii]|uniref:Mutator family transposase n=1 Tax=Sutcliffiella horikoshii TaxID=79883 RepID=A0A5D4SU86_9BACI|nr:hypothetical protein FZC76_18035 [Sutcliffiella horikoshii]
MKVRENYRLDSKGVLIACGVYEEGHREIIGLRGTHGESEDSWSNFFDHLKSRGIQSPKMVFSNAHAELVSAIKEFF